MNYLPELVIEKICQYCDIDSMLNLYESLSPSKRTVSPLQLMQKCVFNFHRSVTELREMNKNVRTKELGLYLRSLHSEVNTWEIVTKLSFKTTFVGSVTILKIANVTLNFNGFRILKEAEDRDLNLFNFSSCLGLEVVTECSSVHVK